MSRPTRELLHMQTAVNWSARSLCKRSGVGCVITSADMKQILSFGYNGPAKGLPNDRCRGTQGTCGCLHAEDNAINSLASNDPNKILFGTTAPCEACAQRIVNAGITAVHYLEPYRNDDGLQVLWDCGVKTYHQTCLRGRLTPPPDTGSTPPIEVNVLPFGTD